MIIVMKPSATPAEIDRVLKDVESGGLQAVPQKGSSVTVIEVLGDVQPLLSAGKDESHFNSLPGVSEVKRISKPYKCASRDFRKEDTVIKVGNSKIGLASQPVIMGGPCSVETPEIMDEIGNFMHQTGISILRGGAFKPRSSPYSHQGSGEAGLKVLRQVADRHSLSVITEVMSDSQVDLVAHYADILQVGARNSQNFELLKALSKIDKPVLLKNGGISGTVKDLLLSAEYILQHGKRNVILCLRGMDTRETAVRNSISLGTIAWLKNETHLPVIVDPSHAAGRWDLITSASLAAIAEGADGLIIESHPRPTEATSDANQTLNLTDFARLVRGVRSMAATRRDILQPTPAPELLTVS